MRHSIEDKTKHTLYLYTGDFERLQNMFPELGASIIVRKLVRNFLTDIDNGVEAVTPDMKAD